MTGDEGWASYAAEQERNAALRSVAEGIARAHAATIDGEFGCCHDEYAFLIGGREPLLEGDDFEPIPDDCPGKQMLDRHIAAICGAGRQGLHACVGCGLELDDDDPNDRCGEASCPVA